MSVQSNVLHASEDQSGAATELARFFRADEVFGYKPLHESVVYASYET